jgi:L-iditol 2-dehydrogenase
MRVAMFNGPGRPITIEAIPDPQPGPDEVLVRVGRCGICGSDISGMSDGAMNLPLGRFGHEWAGEVIEVGRHVDKIKVGDRIAALPVGPCGSCDGCLSGNPLFCTKGSFVPGGFGEYVVIPPVAAKPLPQSLSIVDGALVEPMACGLHALRLAAMRTGARVLVFGAGSMALSVTYWARKLGAGKITLLSRSAHRRDVAITMGADRILGFDDAEQERITETLGGPPDIVAECVGKGGMLDLALKLVRPQGTVLSMGMCNHAEQLVPALCTLKEIRLFFPVGYTVDEFVETMHAFDSGRIDPEIMVSHVIALDELPRIMEAMRSGAMKSLKVHVDPAV